MLSGSGDLANIESSEKTDITSTHPNFNKIREIRDKNIRAIEKREKIDDALTSMDLNKIMALHEINENLYVSDLFKLVATYSMSIAKPDLSAIISYLAIHFPTIMVNNNHEMVDTRALYENLTLHSVSKKSLSHIKGREELTIVYQFIGKLEEQYSQLEKYKFVTNNLDDIVYPDLEKLIASTHPLLSVEKFVDVATMQSLMKDTIPTKILDPFLDLARRMNRYAKRADEIDFIVKAYQNKIQPMIALKKVYRDQLLQDGGHVNWYFCATHKYRLSIGRAACETSFIHAFFELMLEPGTYSISKPDRTNGDIYLDIDHQTALASTPLLTDVPYHHQTYKKFINMVDSIIVLLERASSLNELVWNNKVFELKLDAESIEILKPLLNYLSYDDELVYENDDGFTQIHTYTINAKDLLDIFYEESAVHEIDGLLAEREFENVKDPEKKLLSTLQIFMHQISDDETPQLKLLESKKSDSVIALPIGSLHVELLRLHLANHGCKPADSNALCHKMKSSSLEPAILKMLETSGGWPHLVTNIKWLNQFLKINKASYLATYANGNLNLTCNKQGIGSYCLSQLLQLSFVQKISKCEYRLPLAEIANIPYAVMYNIMTTANNIAKSDKLDYFYQFREAALIKEDSHGHFSPDENLYLSVKQERAAVLKPLLDNFDCIESSPGVMTVSIKEIWATHDVAYDEITAHVEQRLRSVNRIMAIIGQFNKPKRTYGPDGILIQFTDSDIEKRFTKVISFATKSELGCKISYSILFRLTNEVFDLLESVIKHQSPQAFQKRQQDYQKALSTLLDVTTNWQRVNDEFCAMYKGYDSICVKWILETLDIDGIELGSGQPLSISMNIEKLTVRDKTEFEILTRQIIELRSKIGLVEEMAVKVAVSSAKTSLCLSERGITFTFKNIVTLQHFNRACQHIFGQLSEEKLTVCIPYSTCVVIDINELQTMRNTLTQLITPPKTLEEAHSPRIMRLNNSAMKNSGKVINNDKQNILKQSSAKKATNNKSKSKNKSSKSSKSSTSSLPATSAATAVVQQKVIVEKLPPIEPVSADVRQLTLNARQIDFCSANMKPKAATAQRPPSLIDVIVVDGYEYEGSLLADFNLLMTANAWFASLKVDETDIQAFQAAFWFTFVKIFNAIGTRAIEKPNCVQLSNHNDHKALKVRNTILHELNEFSEVMPLYNKLMSDNFESNLRRATDHEKPQSPIIPLFYRNYYQGFFQLKPLIHPVIGIRTIFQRMCSFQHKYFAADANTTLKDKEIGRRAILACIVKLSDFHKRAIVEALNVEEIAGLIPFLESIRESRNLSCHQFINNKDSGFSPLTNETIDRIALRAKTYWELFNLVETKGQHL